MKKIFILLIFISTCTKVVAQSKPETEQWISEKVKKWAVTFNEVYHDVNNTNFITGGYSEQPISFQFSNCKIIYKVKYNLILASYPEDRTYEFNYGDIKSVEWFKNEYSDVLLIVTNGSSIKKKSISTSVISNRNEGVKETYSDRCVIAFKTSGEVDLKNRILKAFNHLKSLCSPSKLQKEVF